MARKRHSDEDILKLLREIEVTLANGSDVASACRSVGISEATYYNWRKRFGGMGRSQLSEMRSLEKENARLKKIVAELELDKLILKESLSHLSPGPDDRTAPSGRYPYTPEAGDVGAADMPGDWSVALLSALPTGKQRR
jgi:transposase-like protein